MDPKSTTDVAPPSSDEAAEPEPALDASDEAGTAQCSADIHLESGSEHADSLSSQGAASDGLVVPNLAVREIHLTAQEAHVDPASTKPAAKAPAAPAQPAADKAASPASTAAKKVSEPPAKESSGDRSDEEETQKLPQGERGLGRQISLEELDAEEDTAQIAAIEFEREDGGSPNEQRARPRADAGDAAAAAPMDEAELLMYEDLPSAAASGAGAVASPRPSPVPAPEPSPAPSRRDAAPEPEAVRVQPQREQSEPEPEAVPLRAGTTSHETARAPVESVREAKPETRETASPPPPSAALDTSPGHVLWATPQPATPKRPARSKKRPGSKTTAGKAEKNKGKPHRDFIIAYDGVFIGHYRSQKRITNKTAFQEVARSLQWSIRSFDPRKLQLYRPVALEIEIPKELPGVGDGAFQRFLDPEEES